MIRIVIVLFLLSAFSHKCFSQAVETIVDGFSNVCEMFIYNDELYFTSFERINDFVVDGKLSKVSLLSEEIVIETILEISDLFTGIHIKDDQFYYTLWSGQEVFRLNLDDINSVPDTIVSDLYQTADIEIAGTDLFVIASQDANKKRAVLKFDLNTPETSPTIYFEEFWPLRIYFHENMLYISTRWEDNIQRLDLSDLDAEVEVFIDSLFGPTALIAIEDNFYFVDNLSETTVDGRVIRVNLNDTDRKLTTIVEGFDGHHELVYFNDYLYISEVLSDKISRFKLPLSTSLDPIPKGDLSIYPNPVINKINVEGKVDEAYNIYTIDGKLVSSGKVNVDSKINVNNLLAGQYILYLRDGGVAKFQKIVE